MRLYLTRILPMLLISLMTASFANAAEIPSQDLTLGSRGEGVVWLQNYLIENSSNPASISLKAAGATGYFGPLTRTALGEYQREHLITPTQGYFGAKTRALISGLTVSHHAPTFSGTISAVDTGCFADGVCSVTIGGKNVILLSGFRISPPAVGSLKGVDSIGDLGSRIGATANVYAATTSGSAADYTLYGSKDYYVEVVPAKPVGKPITVRGVISCLPAKDPTRPVIALCAFGIKTDTGVYYALSDSEEHPGQIANAGVSEHIEISGTLRPEIAHTVFKGEGTIEIKTVKKI